MGSDQGVIILVTVTVVAAVVAWFDARCLADLAHTPDHHLQYFDRRTWALIIVLSFPIGPLLYLRFAKRYPS